MATIEIDGKTFDVENGKMIIEVADEAGIHIPRFCYHLALASVRSARALLTPVTTVHFANRVVLHLAQFLPVVENLRELHGGMSQ